MQLLSLLPDIETQAKLINRNCRSKVEDESLYDSWMFLYIKIEHPNSVQTLLYTYRRYPFPPQVAPTFRARGWFVAGDIHK